MAFGFLLLVLMAPVVAALVVALYSAARPKAPKLDAALVPYVDMVRHSPEALDPASEVVYAKCAELDVLQFAPMDLLSTFVGNKK